MKIVSSVLVGLRNLQGKINVNFEDTQLLNSTTKPVAIESTCLTHTNQIMY